jgi:hypothetical protein
MKIFLRAVMSLRLLKSNLFLPADLLRWSKGNFSGPIPVPLKRNFIRGTGLSDAIWIETGTYKGDTSYYLSRTSKQVVTIEPEPTLFRAAKHRLRHEGKITVFEGTSEERFKDAIAISGDRINFFLDGHASGGETFESIVPTPLKFELECITQSLTNLAEAVIVVDDVRLSRFNVSQNSGYPDLNYLYNIAFNLGSTDDIDTNDNFDLLQ